MGKYIIILSLFLAGCRKFVDIDPSPITIEKRNVFADAGAANAAMNGLYSQMTFGNLSWTNGGVSVYAGLSADEIVNTAANTNADQFRTNTILTTNSIITSFWTVPYKMIYHCNAMLEGLPDAQAIPEKLCVQLTGEAKFCRAFTYFYLINFFGGVPLITSTDYATNATLPQASTADIYQLIVSDLTDAEEKLASTYPTPGRYRPNKWAAAQLLSRVYLYTGKWNDAEREATAVIESGLYNLQVDLNTVYLNGSSEVIWQLARDNNNSVEGSTFVPASATTRPTYALTDTLLKTFEAGDKRKTVWTSASTAAGVTYYYPYKYKQRTSATLTESTCVLRLAELYLIRAEARWRSGNHEMAISDLNVIRGRAGLVPLPPSLTDDEIAAAIEKERMLEYFSEWGHRWFDLKRWGKADQHFSGIKGTWHEWALLYPIPQSQIERNPFLIQNNGY